MDPNPLAETLLAQAAEAAARARRPESTYRFQFHAGFTFRDATAIVPYLPTSASPIATPRLTSRPGQAACTVTTSSTTGPQPGDRQRRRLRGLVRPCTTAGLGQVLDIVPNHMGIGQRERLVEQRAGKRPGLSHEFFDIDWYAS